MADILIFVLPRITIDDEPNYVADPAQLDDGNTLSIAEAYPAAYDDQPSIAADEIPTENEVTQNDEAAPAPAAAPQSDEPPKKKGPKEYVPAAEPVSEDAAVSPAEVIAPAQPQKKVELDEAAADEDDYAPAFGGGSKSQRGQWPMHSFFPMNFGSTSGGAIAVANSFSTGKGGTATSHATAYGSPAAAQKDKKRRLTQQ